ncbi:alpha/beta fold hydrolase [Streptomyces sp. NPDC052016]|uniref:alpha/beta fold hydrolase n=1 Tax=Streptomyces sp. NPDC052016 TaxID=3365680 RepID=UPI0037D7BE3B
MPAILVRGVADTHHVWDGVRQHLTRTDVDAWDLPGFGAARPAGFGSSKEEYVDRLIQRLERVGEPVDLVGHDWGCILTLRVASACREAPSWRPNSTWQAGSSPPQETRHGGQTRLPLHSHGGRGPVQPEGGRDLEGHWSAHADA